MKKNFIRKIYPLFDSEDVLGWKDKTLEKKSN